MQKKVAALGAALVLMLGVVASTFAITNGTPDGTAVVRARIP
jgi:hypothetical protein